MKCQRKKPRLGLDFFMTSTHFLYIYIFHQFFQIIYWIINGIIFFYLIAQQSIDLIWVVFMLPRLVQITRSTECNTNNWFGYCTYLGELFMHELSKPSSLLPFLNAKSNIFLLILFLFLHALSSWWCWFFINAKQTEKLCSYFSSPISKLAMNLGLVELHFVWPNLAIQTNCLVSQKHSFIFFLIFMNLFCLFTLFLD